MNATEYTAEQLAELLSTEFRSFEIPAADIVDLLTSKQNAE